VGCAIERTNRQLAIKQDLESGIFSQDLHARARGTSLQERLICEETPLCQVRENGGEERGSDDVGMENDDAVMGSDGEERESDEVNGICVVSESVLGSFYRGCDLWPKFRLVLSYQDLHPNQFSICDHPSRNLGNDHTHPLHLCDLRIPQRHNPCSDHSFC